MRNFILGFAAGAVTYHVVIKKIDEEEVKKELREFIKAVDAKLAEEKLSTPTSRYGDPTPPETPGSTEEPTP